MLNSSKPQVEVDLVFIQKLANKVLRRMPAHVEFEDLVQSGALAYIEAVHNYDPRHGASLRSYAAIRVVGAMYDEVRHQDWVPRSVVRKGRELNQARARVEARTLRAARHADLMQEMQMDMKAYQELCKDIEARYTESLESFEQEGTAFVSPLADPMEMTERDEMIRLLAKACRLKLADRERRIIDWHYNEEINLRCIGQRMNVSESRVCQIFHNSLKKMRGYMIGRSSVQGLPNGLPRPLAAPASR